MWSHTAQYALLQFMCDARDCRGLFGKYDRIKTLHHARRNLSVTAHLVEFYYTIPRKARAVSHSLCCCCHETEHLPCMLSAAIMQIVEEL